MSHGVYGREGITELVALLQDMIGTIERSVSRIDFIEKASRILIDVLECDLIELRVREIHKYYRCQTKSDEDVRFYFETLPYSKEEANLRIPALSDGTVIERIIRMVYTNELDSTLPCFSPKGSFWTNDTSTMDLSVLVDGLKGAESLSRESENRSLAVVPLRLGERRLGLFCVASRQADFFDSEAIFLYEAIADVLASTMAHQRAMSALQERVKELSCLYDITSVIRKPGISLEATLTEIADHIAPAWRYPDIASSRIELSGKTYLSDGFRDGPSRISAPILVNDRRLGTVEVVYSEKRPERDEGPFLSEERKLIDAVAQQISMIVMDKEAEREKLHLQEQLHHADRLATIGQLASGVAHEINEPLSSVLGFCQLILKDEKLSSQGRRDLEKIKAATLHAREIIKKLLLFGRQVPSQKIEADLNSIIEDIVSILEGHVRKADVKLVLNLDPELPLVLVDASQINQVLVNLVVNAIQAMPEGGTLTLETRRTGEEISMVVEDTGVGMSQEAKRKAFLPFFTTKDVRQGTGLGLAVVHGIVKSHHGRIRFDSRLNRGTRFEIQLPIRGSFDEKEGKT